MMKTNFLSAPHQMGTESKCSSHHRAQKPLRFTHDAGIHGYLPLRLQKKGEGNLNPAQTWRIEV